MHATEPDVSCSFLSCDSLKEDEEGWGRGFGTVSGVRDVYAVRADCSSATLLMQFQFSAPVVRNFGLACCHVKCPVLSPSSIQVVTRYQMLQKVIDYETKKS